MLTTIELNELTTEKIKTAEKSSVSKTKAKTKEVGWKETDKSKAYYTANIIHILSVVIFSGPYNDYTLQTV